MKHAEWDLQVQVVKLLRDAGWVVFHIPNERNSGIADSMRMKAGGVVKGAPDLIAWDNHGYCWWFELKIPKGKRSVEQECMEDVAHNLRVFYAVIRSIDDIKKAIQTVDSYEEVLN